MAAKFFRQWPPAFDGGPWPAQVVARTPLDIAAEVERGLSFGESYYWYEPPSGGGVVITAQASGRFIGWTADGARISGRCDGVVPIGGALVPRLFFEFGAGLCQPLLAELLLVGALVGIAADAVWPGYRPPQTLLEFGGPFVGQYKTILADPPWEEKGGGQIKRGADRHYKVMKTAEIMRLPVGSLCHPDGAHLYLWATNNFMEDAYLVVRAWGFTPLDQITWKKDRQGLGQYLRGITEHVIFAVRGALPFKCDENGKRMQGTTFIEAPRKRHSEKPPNLYRTAERVSYPLRIELFARAVRPGWHVWGDQIPEAAAAAAGDVRLIIPPKPLPVQPSLFL